MFLVPDTSTQLDNMIAKRDSLTNKIIDLGGSAIIQNNGQIKDFEARVVALKDENSEIRVVLAEL